MLRGPQAMKQARAATEGRGRRNYDRAIQAKPGDPFLVRFMGVITPVAVPYTEAQLKALAVEDLMQHALEIGARVEPEIKTPDLIANILTRYEQREPALSARHYIDRNKGQTGRQMFVNCSDAERVLSGEGPFECRYCAATDNLGDKGIGRAQGVYYFSAWDYRRVHQLRSAANENDKKYEPCTLAETNICLHCTWNRTRKPEAKDYRPLYDNGMRYFRQPGMHAEGILAVDRRVRKICRSCGTGKLRPIGACCPNEECCLEFDLDELVTSGWTPDDPQLLTCGGCGQSIIPYVFLECSNAKNPRIACSSPVPSALHDVVVLVEVAGEKQKTVWTYTEQLPISPLNPDDPVDAKILAAKLPDYEEIGKADSVSDQLKNIGISEDPLAEDIPDAPVVGAKAATRSFGTGAKPAGPVAAKKSAMAPQPAKKAALVGKKPTAPAVKKATTSFLRRA